MLDARIEVEAECPSFSIRGKVFDYQTTNAVRAYLR
jgi:hypothetical protein